MLNSSRQLFGYTKDDLAVETLTLDNGILSCDVMTLGAALRSLRVPDRSGIKRDVVLGYDTLEEYESHPGYLGAVVGRVANRIAGGRFTMNGQSLVCCRAHLYSCGPGVDQPRWRRMLSRYYAGSGNLCAGGQHPLYAVSGHHRPGYPLQSYGTRLL